jgi:DNA primase
MMATARRYDGTEFSRVADWALSNLSTLVHDYTGLELDKSGRGACPLHGGDNPEGFSVSASGWHCFTGCDDGGDGVDFVRRYRYGALPAREGRVAAIRELAPRAGVTLEAPRGGVQTPSPRPAPTPPAPPRLSERAQRLETDLTAMREQGMTPAPISEVLRAAHTAMTLGEAGRAYLTARGFKPDAAEFFGFRSLESARDWHHVGTVLSESYQRVECERAGVLRLPVRVKGLGDTWQDAGAVLVLPYHDLRGRVLGFRFRSMQDGALGFVRDTEPRRYHSLGGVALPVPFNAPALTEAVGADLHIAEGEFNAYALSLVGMHAIGLDGAGKWRDEWTAKVQSAKRVVAWYDDDKAGAKGRSTLARTLVEAMGRPWVQQHALAATLPAGDDLNDYFKAGRLVPLLQRVLTP